MAKRYKVTIVATKTMVVNEIDWREDGGFGEFNEAEAIAKAKSRLCDDLSNNPNRGYVKVELLKSE